MSLFDELKRRNVLRVAIVYLAASWLLIQVLETLFPIFRLDETSIQIVVIIVSIGFIPALILSWVFELTPEGLKRDKDVDRSAPATISAGKGLDKIIIVILVLALGYFAVDKFVLDPARDAEIVETATERARTEALYESFGDNSIVVLPFANMSGDPDQEFLSRGISEGVLNLLSRIHDLRVISRTSAFSFEGKDVDIPMIAEQLNVDYILEGSVRKSGDRIRVTAQLIDARIDSRTWANVYDRTLDDIFVIQDEIAAAVAQGLNVELLGESPSTNMADPEAYLLYLQARHLINVWSEEAVLEAMGLLERGLQLDPDFVPALSQLGRVYLVMADMGLISMDESVRRTRELVTRMLNIDPDGQRPNTWMAWMAFAIDNDLVTSARYIERALELDPTNVESLRSLSKVVRDFGYVDEAIAMLEYVVDHDPLCVNCNYHLAYTYRIAGRLEEAEESLRSTMLISPDNDTWRNSLGSTLLLKGEPEAALAEFEAASGTSPPIDTGKILALYDLGRTQKIEEAFETLRETSGEELPWLVAIVYAWIGDSDQAFRWLEKDMPENPFDAYWLIDPLLRDLHDDPRWQQYLAKFGRSAEQLATIKFKITLPPGIAGTE